jgi:phenylalanyl-tRNA synthetase beta chain
VFKYNENRQLDRLRIFELGTRFIFAANHSLQQEQTLAGLCIGNVQPEHWDLKSKEHDFFDLKGDVEALGKLAGIGDLTYKSAQHAALHPSKSASIFKGKQQIGYLGELHPKLAKDFDIVKPLLVFELNFEALIHGYPRKFCCISKFPWIRRDLAIIVDRKVVVYDIEMVIKEITGDLLQDICIFDVYCGLGIPDGQKSLGLGIVLQQPSRTMVDEEINQMMEKIITELKLKFNAILR